MNETKNWKNYIWTIPLIGVIFIFIGILTPTAYNSQFGIKLMYWIWGFSYGSGPGISEIEFFTEMYEIFIPSIVCFLFLIIFFISLIVLVIKEKSKPTSSKNSLIVIGAFIIIVIIVYMVSMEIGFEIYFQRIWEDSGEYGSAPSVSFWETLNVNFGVIGPILGGVFAIIGGIVSKYSDKIDDSIKKRPPITQSPDTKMEQKNITEPPYKYCGNCGAELKGMYCSACGSKA